MSPVVALFNELAVHDKHLDAVFVCDRAFETQSHGLMQAVSVPVAVRVIHSGKLRRYAHLSAFQHLLVRGLVWNNFKDLFKIFAGFFESVRLMRRFNPDVVFTKGGFVCLPVGYAAHVLRIPLVIHDSDTRPGLTNRILARWANVVATGSPLENYHYPAAKSHYVGVPISPRFRPKTPPQQAAYKQKLGFNPDKLLVVAVGGGLGAVSINTAMNHAAPALIEQGIGAFLVAGKAHYDEALQAAPKSELYKVAPFVFERMDEVLGAADIVVTRGSATFLQELAGLGVAAIIVPAHQLGDQIKNAKVFHEAQAALVVQNEGIEQDNRLEQAIITLADDPMMRRELGERLHAFAKPKAAQQLATLIMTAAKR